MVDWSSLNSNSHHQAQVMASDQLSAHISTFKDAKRFKTKSTRKAYFSILNLFAQYAEEEPWPPTADLVMDWLEEVGRSNAEATVASYWSHIRAFFNFCEHSGAFAPAENPVKQMKLMGMTPRQPDLTPVSFTDLQMATVLRHLETRTKSGFKKDLRVKRDYAIIFFTYVTGCRANEIVSLTLTDIDIEKREALIRRKTSKTTRDRFVGFDAAVVSALRSWLEIRPSTKSNRFFVSYGGRVGLGQPLKLGALNQMLKRHCQAAGVTPRKFHALRHSSALAAMDAGIPLHKIKEQLGHRSIVTTEIYLRLRDKEQLKAYQTGDLGSRLVGSESEK